MATLRFSPLLRRASAARHAVRYYGADPYLALYWTVWPSEGINRAMKGELGPGRRLLTDEEFKAHVRERNRLEKMWNT